MFAYCGNNPVSYVDSSGDAPWYAIIPDWGLIHRAVQGYIEDNYGLKTEGRINIGRDTYGRADLYRLNGEIWEVKFCGPASAFAIPQLEWYCSGTLYNGAKPRVGTESFNGEFPYGRFIIKFWTSSPGVILYDFYWNSDYQESTVTATSLIPEKAKSKESATSIFARAFASCGSAVLAMAAFALGGGRNCLERQSK